MLGKLGPSVGWALFIGMMMISSNITGYLTREWKAVNNKIMKYLFASIGLIISHCCQSGMGIILCISWSIHKVLTIFQVFLYKLFINCRCAGKFLVYGK
jgi:hypothetical protein